jgi:hypothetical protein
VLDRVGDKWSLLVIAMLEQRPTPRARFSELTRSIPGISLRMLTATLRSLERDGLLTRHVYAEVPPRVGYICGWMGVRHFAHANRPAMLSNVGPWASNVFCALTVIELGSNRRRGPLCAGPRGSTRSSRFAATDTIGEVSTSVRLEVSTLPNLVPTAQEQSRTTQRRRNHHDVGRSGRATSIHPLRADRLAKAWVMRASAPPIGSARIDS